MKTSNRRYAKRQSQWIRNKLLPAVQASKAAEGGKSVEVYLLDATGLHYPSYPKLEDQRLIVEFISTESEEWSSGVRDLAVSLTEGRENRLFRQSAILTFTPIPGTAFLKCEPLPDPLSLSSAAKSMLSVPTKVTE